MKSSPCAAWLAGKGTKNVEGTDHTLKTRNIDSTRTRQQSRRRHPNPTAVALKSASPHFRGVKTRSSFAQVVVNTSSDSSKRAEPSSPLAKVMSNSRTSFEMTVLSSLRASCFPMHPYRPMLNGNQALLLMTKSGSVVQRSGINSSGLPNALGAAQISSRSHNAHGWTQTHISVWSIGE